MANPIHQHHLGFHQIVQKCVRYLPFSILMAINVLWTCNLGPKFLSKDEVEVLLDSNSALMKNICLENVQIATSMSIQLAAFIAIKLIAVILLTLTGPCGVKMPRMHFQKFELCLLILLKLFLSVALGLYIWHALTIPEENEFSFPHHTHFATLALLTLQIIYALLLTIRQFYFG